LTRPIIHRRPISKVAAASPGIEPHLSDELPTSGVFKGYIVPFKKRLSSYLLIELIDFLKLQHTFFVADFFFLF
jgi:hypothetical protein